MLSAPGSVAFLQQPAEISTGDRSGTDFSVADASVRSACTQAPAKLSPAVALARDFSRELATLLRREHSAMADFLLALAEFDGRRLRAALGYASLFDFLHRELRLSRSAAYYRSAAAALVQRHPEVIEPLADGRLCVTSLAQVARVISRENVSEILPRFFHLSSREAKDIAAEIAPVAAPPLRDVVTTPPHRPLSDPLCTSSPSGSCRSSGRTSSAGPTSDDSGQVVQALFNRKHG